MFGSVQNLSFPDKLNRLSWPLVAVVMVTGLVGVVLLYSLGGLSFAPWAGPQLGRLLVGFALMVLLGTVAVRIFWEYAYWFYLLTLLLLLLVEVMGQTGMGAQRWLQLGGMVVQPAELMKLGLILALSRYFNDLPHDDIGNALKLIPPLLLLGMPAALVLMQPNLGTTLLLVATAGTLFWLAGVKWWKFALLIVLAAAAMPVAWSQLHDYQRQRVLTFLDPEADPLGTGYNIAQAKIALGAGGFFGRGLGSGTQSQLDFVPEIHTDFIFVVLAEEFGLLGTFALLLLYGSLILYGWLLANNCRSHFSRLVAMGILANFFFSVAINLGMVSGLLPVVGLPLPLVSYGGTQLITFMMGFGILLSVAAHREQRLHQNSLF
ncbi:MAG: rod shape-determining protein RodA [Alphaproteobacteria bacterium]|nr:rod shape-determining protein RodA [Alphaproteobacteria bacterium]NDC55510.1 rod shape-determining protein RodA [Alphaproteobacteria bacterium]NDG04385.1 rod shape-determining protein RodA [Alphaproteobacteria bacterium]